MPFIGDKTYNRLLVDLDKWKDDAEAAFKREATLVAEIRDAQAKMGRLTDMLERKAIVDEAKIDDGKSNRKV